MPGDDHFPQPIEFAAARSLVEPAPVVSALRILSDQANSSRLRPGMMELIERLEHGEPLDQALENSKRDLPEEVRLLIAAGVQVGRLDAVMECLTEPSLRQAQYQKQTRSTLLLALMIGWMVALYCGGFLVLIVPEYTSMYRELNTPIFGLTYSLVAASKFLNRTVYGWELWRMLLASAIGISLVLVIALTCTQKIRSILSLRVISRLFRRAALADFCRYLAILLEAKVPLASSVRISSLFTEDPWLIDVCQKCTQQLQRGLSVASLAQSAGMPPGLVNSVFHSASELPTAENLRCLAEVYGANNRSSLMWQYVSLLICAVASIGLFIGVSMISMIFQTTVLLNSLG